MRLVIDTNVLLVSISRRSSVNWLFQSMINGGFTFCATTDILDEYAEIFNNRMGNEIAENVMKTIINLENIKLVTKYFTWQLIEADNDDNKFVDCAIAANADYIVTHDKHFNILKTIDFPKVNIINIQELERILSGKHP